MKKYLLPLISSIFSLILSAQTNISGIINNYAAVSNVILCNNQIEINNIAAFSTGDSVLLIQMKGATMNTSNTNAFGDLINLNNAGKYEYNVIDNISGNTITLLNTFAHSYDVSGVVQLVSFPSYNGNVTVTSTLTAQSWDGSTGGILAFKVDGTLILNADIDVSGLGFRGGRNLMLAASAYNCNIFAQPTNYSYANNTQFAGEKGEGLAIIPATIGSGKGKSVNGGGGGNQAQGGGAGGAGYGNGGNGSLNDESGFFTCDGDGGAGGIAIQNTNRYIFSGGGGAGHGNNATYFGGNAGGLIYLKANNIVPNSNSILSEGTNGLVVGRDGGSGGGAGGIVVLDVPTSTSFLVSVKGGNGSTVNASGSNDCQGPGGGGGGGLILNHPTLTFTSDISGGLAGTIINTTGACTGLNPQNGSSGAFISTVFPNSVFDTSSFTNTTIINDTICSNENYTLPNGTIVNGMGIYYDTLLTNLGCDSFIQIVLEVLAITNTTINIITCDSSMIGTSLDTLNNLLGCDSIVTTVTTLSPSYYDTTNLFSCNVSDTGLLITNDTTTFGCDSITTFITALLSSYSETIYSSSCDVLDTGIFVMNNTTILGCDSITTNIINFVSSFSDTIYSVSCNVLDTGVIVTNDTTNIGCDSITITITSLLTSYLDTIYTTSCNVIDTGFLVSNDTTSLGCDSIITVITSFSPSFSDTINTFSCNVIDTGIIIMNDTTSLGCDSIITIITALSPTYSDTINSTSCNILDTGVFVMNYTTSLGCDSTITTIVLLTPNLSDSIFSNSCNVLDTGIFIINDTTSLGCDSITTSIVSFSFVTPSIINASICIGDNYVLPDGELVSLAGVYIDTLTSFSNCDSIITTNLTILSDTAIIISEPNDVVICPESPGFNFDLTFDILNVNNYQWQINLGAAFVNVTDVDNFTGSNTSTLTVSVPYDNVDSASFRLVYTDDCGNINISNQYSVSVSEPDPVIGIEDITFCKREIGIIEVDYDGTDYVWNDLNQTVGRFLVPEISGEYTVTFRQNSSSCLTSDMINVVIEDCLEKCVVTASTGFSPNGTGINDVFKAISSCELDFFELIIVNRWGEIVFITNKIENGWDGTHKNLPAPVGNYVWSMKYNKAGESKQQELSGNLTIIR